ncbi:hypothetical protein ACVRWQ_06105 [Streptococcus phocae subsp. salmonis]|uniref:hypothetical protein n=1 Tax=Streptococcus phocae TaxID=119224 RepID=UPI00068D33F4|nr:hypothetical protein [Streptococcus phocae]QBX27862.1 hyaluronoglucosaminidase [Streptococcus phage Javan420]
MPILKFYDKQSSSWKVVGGGQGGPKAEYLTQEQADSLYAKVSQIANLAEKSEVEKIKQDYLTTTEADKKFVLKTELGKFGDSSKNSVDVDAINEFLGLSQKVFSTEYNYSDGTIKSYANRNYSASWYVNEPTKDVSVRDKVLITIRNTTTRVDNYLEVQVTAKGSNYVTATSTGKLLTTPGEVKVLTKEQAEKDYTKKGHKHNIADVNGLQNALDQKANFSHFHSMSDILGLERALQNSSVPSDVVRRSELNSYAQIATLGPLLQNIGKVQDQSTGQFLSIQVVDKGQVPRNTRGLIVFERS